MKTTLKASYQIRTSWLRRPNDPQWFAIRDILSMLPTDLDGE
jgi:hypothetical protein